MASPAGARSEDWDCLSPEAQRLAEARLAAKRAARAEAREIRMKELERQQKEVEERPDKDFTEKGSRNMPSLSAATLASLGGTSSRRGSGDTSISIDTEASTREIKDSLAEVEEKYKKAMVSNAQLDNEKTNFMYQVDTLKDVLLELEEELAEARRQCEEKGKELERERHAHSVLQFQLAEVKEALRQRDEMLEKHGIILSSEAATSGEAAATPSNVESPSPTQMTKEEMNALRSPGDGALGRAKEVEVEKEIVENVGKREILQNARQERPREVVAQDGAHGEVSYPSENAEGRNASENLKNAECEEQVQRQSPENCEATRQVGSQEVIVLAKETGASLASPKCPEDFDSGAPGPVHRQDTCNALDGTEQGEKSVGRQDQENQDLKTDREEMQGSPPLLGPEAGRVSYSDPGEPGGGHTEKELEVGTAAVEAPGSLHGNRPADELDSGAGHSAEKALTEQEAAGPAEASTQSTAGREDSGEQEGGAETKGEKPGQAEAQAIPGAPTAQNSQDEAPGPGTTDADREPSEGKSSVQAEASDSAQKKSRNKKKKNKKKKSPAPVESLDDVRKELTYQNMDEGEVREELEPGTDQMPVAEAPEEVTEEATNSSVAGAGSGERVGFPEAELDGKLNQEEENGKAEDGSREAARDTRDGAGGTSQPAEGVTNGCGVGTTGVTPGAEAMGETRSSLQPSAGSTVDACDTGSSEWPETSQQQSQTVLEAADGVGLEKGDLSVPLGEPGDLDSESGGHGKEGSEKGKGKEDCTMS